MALPSALSGALRLLRLLLALLGACGIAVVAVLLLIETIRLRHMPALESWQTRVPEAEFAADEADRIVDLDDYLAVEDALFRELATYMIDPAERGNRSMVIRYIRGGPGDPATFEPNWNRTVELRPQGEPRGAVLLLHGLTDSPYSMRSLAEAFQAEGYVALCLRVPGHGTVPAGLLEVTTDDWMAAVRIGWRHVLEVAGPDRPVHLCGYSNGGALAVLHTLELLADGARTPDSVVLLSPAIGITPFAAASNFHKVYSWIPWFAKAKWLGVEPEYDPFKYNSFPKNAGAQSWAMTRLIERAMATAQSDGSLARIPPILTFQSVVDSTIVARDVLTRLYERLPANGSELVVFDLNHGSVLDGFFANPHPPLDRVLEDPSLRFAFTVVGNSDADTMSIVARTNLVGSDDVAVLPLELRWPDQVYSLAHVAIPFPPDDVMYGSQPQSGTPLRLPIGRLALRGEKNVLTISAADLLRLRHNPFHQYMRRRVVETLKVPTPKS